MAAVMRHAGAVRIDHAMGVWQLFFIPLARPAAEGTYVRFPIEDMLSTIAAESNEFRTIVVGEDLGNVPEGFRDVMYAAGLQSYRILYFERHDHGFRQPHEYPKDALACLSTHDLPTIEGWWRGADIDLRLKYRLIDERSADAQRESRRHERHQLAGDLVDAGLIHRAAPKRCLSMDLHGSPPLPENFVAAVHRQLSRTASRLAAVRIEDLAGERQPVNLPGTVLEYPNWRRRLGADLDSLAATGLFRSVTEAMRGERPGEADAARRATYRLQFRNGMTFDRATEIVPYLKRLGVSHLYASPIFCATTGSSHGYDVTDFNRIDPPSGAKRVSFACPTRSAPWDGPHPRHRARTTWPPRWRTPGGRTSWNGAKRVPSPATSTSTGRPAT